MNRLPIVAILLMGVGLPHAAQAQQAPPFALQNAMPPAAFASAGLSKLTPSELDYLSRWVALTAQNYANSQVSLFQHATPATPTVMESRIDGDYNGWDGETVYRLQNGQVWQQASYHYHYHYAYAPEVTIVSTATGAKMTVSGDDGEPIAVRRLK